MDLFDLFVKLSLDDTDFNNRLADVNNRLNTLSANMGTFSANFQAMNQNLTSVGGGFTAVSQNVDTLNNSITQLNSNLNNTNSSTQTTASGLSGLNGSAQTAGSNLNGLNTQLQNTNSGLQDAGSSANTAASGFDVAGKAISGAASMIGTAAKAIGAAIAATAAGVGMLVKSSVDAYADYEQLVGGVETLFSNLEGTVSAAPKVLENAEKAFQTAGMSANEYMETVTSFSAALVSSLEGDYDKAAEISDMAIQDMADNSNKMGTALSSLQTAYAGFAKQNYTMLDNLNIMGALAA